MKLAALFRRTERAPVGGGGGAPVSAARTHLGRVRTVNEDRLIERPERGLWGIADGMGGHAAGDVAAGIVIDALHALADAPGEIEADAVRGALAAANAAIRASNADPRRRGGATAVALLLDGARATVLWAGDSRAYRWRDGVLAPVSRDHSVVQELIDAGTLDPARARSHPHAHVVTRALGVAAEVEVDAVALAVAPGDVLLLCSDGLSGPVPEAVIAGALRRAPAAAADALIAAALAAGGPDNVSVVVVAAPTTR